MFNKLAQDYQDKFMDVNLYRDSFNLFCDSVQAEKASIIEIACGPGNITQFLLHKRPDFNLLGTDLAPNMIELARLNNPSANFKLLDCREIKTIHQKIQRHIFYTVQLSIVHPSQGKEDSCINLNSVA